MSLHRLWELMVWLSPYVLTGYVGLMLLLIGRLVWLGHHERAQGGGPWSA